MKLALGNNTSKPSNRNLTTKILLPIKKVWWQLANLIATEVKPDVGRLIKRKQCQTLYLLVVLLKNIDEKYANA
jgi:hypothetical protein